jgi:ABC-type multidrug transport system fused ATPase/permease subunit
MKIITKLLFLLSDQEKKKTLILFVLILTMALIDMLGVASILPFIAVLTNPDLLQTNSFLSNVFKFTNNYGLETENQFFILLGALVFILLILSLIMKAVTTYAKLRFTQMREYSIAKRLTESYLHQPYSWFLDRHSADLGKSILSEVSAIAGQGIQPMINLIAQVMVVITLLTLLILVDYKITIVTCFVFLFSYFVIYHLTRSFIKKIGKERFIANQERFKILNEVFGSFKEVKLGNLENYFINKFSNPAKIYAKHQSSYQAIGQLPRYVIEVVAFGGLLIVILYLLKSQGTFSNSIPIISLFAYAGYRLMPAIQQIYLAITQLRYVGPSLDAIYNDLRKLKLEKIVEDKNDFIFDKNITLNQIHYNYPNTSRTALQNINLEIKAKSKVGIIGSTGSGKTTLVDIILGLLTPQKGLLTIDDKILDENNIKSWQRLISYVPQQIFLVDDTIKANIGFGFDPDEN